MLGFCSSEEFAFFFPSFFNFNFFKPIIIFLHLFLFAFPTVLFPLQLIFNIHKSSYLPLFNFAYLFFLFFLSFPLNIFLNFIFFALFPNWHLPLVLFSSLCCS